MIPSYALQMPFLLEPPVDFGFLHKHFGKERYLTMAADLEKVFALNDKTLLSVADAAALLGISAQTLRKIIKSDNALRIVKMSNGKNAPQMILSRDLQAYVTAILEGGK